MLTAPATADRISLQIVEILSTDDDKRGWLTQRVGHFLQQVGLLLPSALYRLPCNSHLTLPVHSALPPAFATLLAVLFAALLASSRPARQPIPAPHIASSTPPAGHSPHLRLSTRSDRGAGSHTQPHVPLPAWPKGGGHTWRSLPSGFPTLSSLLPISCSLLPAPCSLLLAPCWLVFLVTTHSTLAASPRSPRPHRRSVRRPSALSSEARHVCSWPLMSPLEGSISPPSRRL